MRRLILFALCAACYSQTSVAVDLVGYIPYYRMSTSYDNNTLPTQLGMLDEVRYFGLTVGSDGSIQPLAGSGTIQGHENNIAIIKQKIDAIPAAQRPRLDITLGGAGEAANFATIAANSALSATFAQNIHTLLSETGATSIDIDWEHPVGSTQFDQYGTLLQRIKQEVGASQRVYATIDPTIRVPLSVFNGPNAIDGISLMTYDLGWWANDQADPDRGEHSLSQYVTDAVDAWTDPPGSSNRRPYVFSVWGQGRKNPISGSACLSTGESSAPPNRPSRERHTRTASSSLAEQRMRQEIITRTRAKPFGFRGRISLPSASSLRTIAGFSRSSFGSSARILTLRIRTLCCGQRFSKTRH